MRSKGNKIIEINRMAGYPMPPHVELAQRHFEKEAPPVSDKLYSTLIAPVDLLGKVFPPEMIEGIESFEMVYKRRQVIL